MRQLFKLTFLAFILVTFSSCFELLEEVTMNKDGSGEVMFTVNLSESKDNLKNFMEAGEFQGKKLPTQAEILAKIDELKTVLQQAEGISNVRTTEDFDMFMFTISGDFENVKALNSAANFVADKMNETNHPLVIEDNYSWTNNKFSRLFNYEIDQDEYNKLGVMEKMLMESARFVSIYRFPEPVTAFSNENARLSGSKTAVMLNHTLGEIASGSGSIENIIEY